MSDRRPDAERIAALADLMGRHGLAGVKIKLGDVAYELERDLPRGAAVEGAVPASQPQAVAGPPQAAPNVKKVTAPLVGVFYRAPAPGAEPFVEPGDRVEVGQTLCIVEAMKLMNEIASDFAGTVRRVVPENGALVALGEELFWIEP
jgi:acetyl-CoA carboxylase biotin carboxyl carrier protein